MPLSFNGPDSFFSADEEAWWASVDKALKGASRQKLFGVTDDGLEIAPLYARRSDSPARSLRQAAGDWTVVQRIDIADPAAANAQILEDLQGGAGGLEVIFPNAMSAHGHGVRITGLAGLETLLKDVEPDLITVRLEAGPDSPDVLALMLALLEKRKIDPASVVLTVGFDPYGWTAVHGIAQADMDQVSRQLQDVAGFVHALGSPARLLTADGRIWHDAGATPAQELAYVLASAAAHLRVLEGTALAPEDWADRISMCLVAEADQFGTIAKARALRALWSCVLEGAGLPQVPADLHMSTSYRMLTTRDPWVNLLRNSVAAFSAGIGGADGICVLPHTLAVGVPDGFARRLARNTQSILLEESNLARVMDPSAGSGAIEDRTDKLCAAAWELFQEVEAAGGMFQALDKELVQDRIGTARAELDRNVARRKRPITGVSEFPDLSETGVSVLGDAGETGKGTAIPPQDLPEPGEGQWFAALKKLALDGGALLAHANRPGQTPGEPSLQVLAGGRIAEPFEELRAEAAAYEDRTGAPPKVFLASLGTLAQFTPRATWTANAFAAGGLKATGPEVYGSLEELVAAYRKSGAALACFVSTDEVYEDQVEAAAKSLKEAGAAHLYLAGKPGAREASYKEAGIGTFLFAGCDLLDLLKDAHSKLEMIYDGGQSDLEVLK